MTFGWIADGDVLGAVAVHEPSQLQAGALLDGRVTFTTVAALSLHHRGSSGKLTYNAS